MNAIKVKESYSDEEVISKIVAGETALFEIIVRRYNPFLHKTGRAYGFNHEDTQDLMQETFVSAYLHLHQFENRSSLKTWMIKIMLRHCYRKQQKSSFKNEIASDIPEQSNPAFSMQKNNDAHQALTNRELNHVIENALSFIPLDYRMVFTLREINGLNVAETVESLDITEANVKVRLNRAKIMLRKELEKTYTPEDIFEFNLVYCEAMVKRVMDEIHNLI